MNEQPMVHVTRSQVRLDGTHVELTLQTDQSRLHVGKWLVETPHTGIGVMRGHRDSYEAAQAAAREVLPLLAEAQRLGQQQINLLQQIRDVLQNQPQPAVTVAATDEEPF